MTKEATAVKEVPELPDPEESQEAEGNGKRERSRIEWPYLDMDDAIEIAEGVHQLTGSSCQIDQLAAKLNQAASGGAFRQRLTAARLFGFIAVSQGTVTLTPLGTRVCDPQHQAA